MYACTYVWGASWRRGTALAVLFLRLLSPSSLGATERPTDRSYTSHPSMSSELLLSPVSLSLSPARRTHTHTHTSLVHQSVCRSHTTFSSHPSDRATDRPTEERKRTRTHTRRVGVGELHSARVTDRERLYAKLHILRTK